MELFSLDIFKPKKTGFLAISPSSWWSRGV